jgi:hypothetical protein
VSHVFCTIKVPAELHEAFAAFAGGRYRTIEWMVLEFMRASVSRTTLVETGDADDQALIITARKALHTWSYDKRWMVVMALGRALVRMREQAARTAGASCGRRFSMAMNDLLARSGLSMIDKRTRSYLVKCFENRDGIRRWRQSFSLKRRPKGDPRQIWRAYREYRVRRNNQHKQSIENSAEQGYYRGLESRLANQAVFRVEAHGLKAENDNRQHDGLCRTSPGHQPAGSIGRGRGGADRDAQTDGRFDQQIFWRTLSIRPGAGRQ